MIATATADTHRRIEQLAARILDLADDLGDVRGQLEQLAQQEADWFTSIAPLVEAIAMTQAAEAGSSKVIEHERGPAMVLAHAVLIDVLFGKGREKLRMCPHRGEVLGYDDTTVVCVPLRFAGCPTCTVVMSEEHDAALADDHTCDVCGEVTDALHPLMVPVGGAFVGLFVGRCCLELVEYQQPARVRTYRRVGRNDRCPCGSDAKFKRCCGATE